MEMTVSRFSQFMQSLRRRQPAANKVGLLGGLLFVGWLAGGWVSGFLSNPAPLNAAISDNTQVSEHARHEGKGFADVASVIRPAVVHIAVVHEQEHSFPDSSFNFEGREFFDRRVPTPPRRSAKGMGSGVLISANGYIVTNHHVVDGATQVTVTLLDKRQFEGQVLGMDPQTDLAVVKIKGGDLPYLHWGDSSRLQVGDYVLAVGSPFGLTATVTQGIVSGLGRDGMGITQYEDFIQTDAAINPGNSGGALVNAQGELIGINTAIFSRTGGYQGIGFAVPASMAQSVYTSVVENGKVVRGYLGVGIQALTPELAQSFDLVDSKGALVTEVKPHSPAAESGLMRGDAVIRYEESPIDSPRALQREVMKTPLGTTVTVTVIRAGKEKSVHPTIVEPSGPIQLAKASTSKPTQHFSGLTVGELDAAMAQQLGLDRQVKGVVVTNVRPGSTAEQAGLVRGDIIQEVNRNAISSIEEYELVTRNLAKGQAALLFIERKGAALFLSVKV